MALPTVPEWLKLRSGSLQNGLNGNIVFVILGSQPQYRLDVRPAGGQHTCTVTQTVNGKGLGDGTKYPTADAALTGGLETLRNRLGW